LPDQDGSAEGGDATYGQGAAREPPVIQWYPAEEAADQASVPERTRDVFGPVEKPVQKPGPKPPEPSGDPEGREADGMLFRQRVSGAKDWLGLSLGRYTYPDELTGPPWAQCLQALENGSIVPLQSALNRTYEAKLDAGFRNVPDYATLLVRRAHRMLDGGEFLEARLLAEAAYNLAPEFYPVTSSLARLSAKGPQGGVGKALRWQWISLGQKLNDFVWQFTTAGKAFALALMALYLFFLALGLYMFGRYGKALLHSVREQLPSGRAGKAAVAAILLATALFVLFLPGPFWAAVFVGLLTGRFARRWERICYALFLLIWACSPWLLTRAVCFFLPLSDGTRAMYRCTQGEWDATAEQALDAAVQRDPDSLDLQLTKALIEKRRGNYEEAGRILRKALLANPQSGRLWNNLGNLHAIQGDLEEAKSAYRKAVLYGNGSAAPHYNMSQLLRREFSFFKGGQEYSTARGLDADRVDYFTYINSPNPNRFFMDEEPAKAALWHYAFTGDSETERAAEELWESTVAGVPLRHASWVFLLLAGVYILFLARRGKGPEPFACSGCGRVVCGNCDVGAEVGGLCSPCYQALYQREHISKERRHGQIRRMARFQSRRSRRLLLVNLLLPGLGITLLEDTPRGMFTLFGFVFLVLVTGFWSDMLPVPMTVWESGGPLLRLLLLPLLVALYLHLQRTCVTKIRARR
jgi:tetratricopeptide (TPR) repeat protein